MNFSDFKKVISQRQEELKKRKLPFNISPAQFQMLEYLWNAGESFPRNWVARNELHNLINQSDYRRRLSELKNDRGIDIEINKSSNHYRLKSANLNPANPRAYLTKKQKLDLLRSEGYRCQTCGEQDINNTTGTLQADHKIPLSRNGSHVKENWQTLCHVCNVVKRRACKGCKRDCNLCVWAFPNKYGSKLLLNFDPKVMKKLVELELSDNEAITKYIEALILKD